MASWRAPGSILEAPGSIFEAPELDLGGFWNAFFEIFGQNAKKAKNAKNACQNKSSITNVPRVGGRRCSPPGGFQSAAHPKDVQGVLNHSPNRLSNSPKPISNGESERLSS